MTRRLPPHEHLPSSLELACGRHVQDVQHGTFMIADQLEQLGLEAWTGRVMGYLHMYDGIESWLEPGDIEAVDFVRQLLFKEIQRSKGQKEAPNERRFRLAMAMANAPVASYGAAFKIQRNLNDPIESIWWKPLEQSWLRFLAQRETLPDYTRLYLSSPCEFRAPAQALVEYLMAPTVTNV